MEEHLMNKYFGFGSTIAIISVIIGFITSACHIVFIISGISFLLPFLLAGLLTGAFIGGDRIRGNYYTESKEDREDKSFWTKNLILLGIPNLLIIITLIGIGMLL
jgi:F0F1-type ATP synthase membrane subunit c/vacuolar-type H+-ATPase subunit K